MGAVLDGEIVCLDEQGRTQFRDLLFRRGGPRFYAFDLLGLNGEDLRLLPLVERKRRLRRLVPQDHPYLLYCDHVERGGFALFEQACNHDLEGIVAKRKDGAYLPGAESDWLKIRNCNYSQWPVAKNCSSVSVNLILTPKLAHGAPLRTRLRSCTGRFPLAVRLCPGDHR